METTEKCTYCEYIEQVTLICLVNEKEFKRGRGNENGD